MHVLLCIPLFLVACILPSKSKQPLNEIRISLPSEPPTLDWNLATDNVSYQILNQLMEGLTQYDKNLNPIPAVAKSWEVLEDGHVTIFHLNQNYRWSDGKQVLAQDFRYSWLRLLKPETAAEYAYFLFDIQGAKEFNAGTLKDENQVGIHVVDDFTLKVILKNPVVFFPAITTFMVTYPLREDGINKYGDRWTDSDKIVTCGPFLLEEWWHDYRLKFKKNPNYGGNPLPSLDRITLFLVSDPSSVLSLYQKNELDMASPPPLALPFFHHDDELISKPRLRGYYYAFNVHKKPFDQIKVRQAFALSLNKKEIPTILKGGELAVDSWIPPGLLGYDEKRGLHFNPELARQRLKEAGFNDQNPFPRIELVFNSDPVNKKIAEWAINQWKTNLGVYVELKNEEWKSYLSTLKTDPPPLFRLGWGADYPDPDNFMNLFTSFSGNNHTGWKSKTYDQLITQGSIEKKLEKRKIIYDELQQILLEKETVIMPLFIPVQNILVKKKWQPFPLSPLDFVYYKEVKA